MVVDMLHFQSRLTDKTRHIVGVIHLAVAVGNCGEVEARHCQTECGWLKTLTVPQSFHNEHPRIWAHRSLGSAKDAHNLLLGETVKELRHPDGIYVVVLRLWQFHRLVEQIYSDAIDTLGAGLTGHIAAHHLDLLRQIDDCNVYIRLVLHTFQGPFAGIAAYIVKRAHIMLDKHKLKRFGKRRVALEVVESKPAFLYLLRTRRQSFLNGGPRAEMLQSSRTSFLQRFLKAKPPLVVNIMVKVDINSCSRIIEQKPSCL